MFKFSINTPAISTVEFAALVEVQPNLAQFADSIIIENERQAVTVASRQARARIEKYEYISETTTVLSEDKDFWVTEFTIYGD